MDVPESVRRGVAKVARKYCTALRLDPEDLMQEAYARVLTVFVRRPTLDQHPALMWSVARRGIVDYLRKQLRMRRDIRRTVRFADMPVHVDVAGEVCRCGVCEVDRRWVDRVTPVIVVEICEEFGISCRTFAQ